MAYVITENLIGAQALSEASTTKNHPLRKVIKATDATNGEGTFIYAQASLAILQYDAVFIKPNGKAVKTNEITYKLAATAAYAQIAFAADEYGWFQQTGLPLVRLAPATEKETALYVNVSDGVLSGVTSSCMIAGIVAVTSVTTTVNAVTCVANFPVILRAQNLTGSVT